MTSFCLHNFLQPTRHAIAISWFRSCLSAAFLSWCGGAIAWCLMVVYRCYFIYCFTVVPVPPLLPSPAGVLLHQRELFGQECMKNPNTQRRNNCGNHDSRASPPRFDTSFA